MSRPCAIGLTSAFITRIQEQVFDPQLIATLQERLAAHGAELQGQLPELLLRSNSPEEAVRSWLADKDLSHWIPQSLGGTAQQGWQFETANWNRSRGAEPMSAVDVVRAHFDGGIDTLRAPGVAADIAGHWIEAAVLAMVIAIAWEMLSKHGYWRRPSPFESQARLCQTLRSAGLAAMNGASLSIVISIALTLIPGAQAWLLAGGICCTAKGLPGDGNRAFDLRTFS
jgi:phage-related protein